MTQSIARTDDNELLHRRAYQVGYMRSAVEQALRYLDCGENEWARKRLVEALEVGK